MKKFMSVLLMVCMLLSGASSVFAAEPESSVTEIEPRGVAIQFEDYDIFDVSTTVNGIYCQAMVRVDIWGSYVLSSDKSSINSITLNKSAKCYNVSHTTNNKASVKSVSYSPNGSGVTIKIVVTYSYDCSGGACALPKDKTFTFKV